MQKWGMSYANQDELVTLAGGLAVNHYWNNEEGHRWQGLTWEYP